MKRFTIVMLLFVVSFVPSAAFAQKFEITPFFGYRFSDSYYDYSTNTKYGVDDDVSYGLTFDYTIDRDRQFEFLWSHQETGFDVVDGADPNARFDLDIDYIHIGGVQTFDNGETRPFVSGSLGATYINPADESYSSDTLFSMAVGGGVKYFPADNFGVRLDGRIYGSYVGSDGGAFCGSNGCIYGYGGSVYWQVEFTVGLIFGGG